MRRKYSEQAGDFALLVHIDAKGGGWDNAPAIERNVEKDGVKYDVYTFTRI